MMKLKNYQNNNTVSNLEWCSYRENINHAVENKLSSCGEKNGRAKLTEIQVKEIRDNDELNQYQLADKYNVSQGTISRIKTKKGWN